MMIHIKKIPSLRLYWCDKQGNIFSVRPNEIHQRRIKKLPNGYMAFSYQTKSKKITNFYVHRAIAETWIKVSKYRKQFILEVNHKNSIKSDNRVQNLEWVASSENNLHAMRMSLHKRGSQLKHAKLNEEKVLHILKSKKSNRDLSKLYEVDWNTIYRIRNRSIWKHVELK